MTGVEQFFFLSHNKLPDMRRCAVSYHVSMNYSNVSKYLEIMGQKGKKKLCLIWGGKG